MTRYTKRERDAIKKAMNEYRSYSYDDDEDTARDSRGEDRRKAKLRALSETRKKNEDALPPRRTDTF